MQECSARIRGGEEGNKRSSVSSNPASPASNTVLQVDMHQSTSLNAAAVGVNTFASGFQSGFPSFLQVPASQLGEQHRGGGAPSASAINRLSPRSLICVLAKSCSSWQRVLSTWSTAATGGAGTVTGASPPEAAPGAAPAGSHRKATSCGQQAYTSPRFRQL